MYGTKVLDFIWTLVSGLRNKNDDDVGASCVISSV